MKKFVLNCILLLGIVVLAYSQADNYNGTIKCYHVSSDKMNYKQGFVPDANTFWVETDESFGEVVLNFDGLNQSKTLISAKLILNIPQVPDAQSNTGVEVYADGKLIGNAQQANANSNLQMVLDINALRGKSTITLILKGGGADGLAIYSKASGFGAVLMLTY